MTFDATYIYSTSLTPAANSNTIEIFNATGSGKVIKVDKIEVSARPTGTITGLVACFQAFRTSAVGTGGTTITGVKNDSNDPAIPAQITCRTGSTISLPTSAAPICGGSLDTDESRYTVKTLIYDNYGNKENKELTIRENQGLTLRQGNLLAVGSIIVTMEIVLV